VNEVICHGIPDCRELKDGDIVNIDISVYYNGYHGDLNETFCVGTVSPEYKKLIKVTHDAMIAAMAEVRPGTLVRRFGHVISRFVEPHGYSVVRTYCGHGIGEMFHCLPNVPHYSRNKAVGICEPGMVFTIEPMINIGGWRDETWPDDWTSVTKDGKRSAQFEHTMVVTQTGCEVLTARTRDSTPLWWELEDPTPIMGEDYETKCAVPKIVNGRLEAPPASNELLDELVDEQASSNSTGGNKKKGKKKNKNKKKKGKK
jgi:methionyl aminopeptidase